MRTIGQLCVTRAEVGQVGHDWKAAWEDIESIAYTGGSDNEVSIVVAAKGQQAQQTHQVVLGLDGGLEQLVDFLVTRQGGHISNPVQWDFTFTPHSG